MLLGILLLTCSLGAGTFQNPAYLIDVTKCGAMSRGMLVHVDDARAFDTDLRAWQWTPTQKIALWGSIGLVSLYPSLYGGSIIARLLGSEFSSLLPYPQEALYPLMSLVCMGSLASYLRRIALPPSSHLRPRSWLISEAGEKILDSVDNVFDREKALALNTSFRLKHLLDAPSDDPARKLYANNRSLQRLHAALYTLAPTNQHIWWFELPDQIATRVIKGVGTGDLRVCGHPVTYEFFDMDAIPSIKDTIIAISGEMHTSALNSLRNNNPLDNFRLLSANPGTIGALLFNTDRAVEIGKNLGLGDDVQLPLEAPSAFTCNHVRYFEIQDGSQMQRMWYLHHYSVECRVCSIDWVNRMSMEPIDMTLGNPCYGHFAGEEIAYPYVMSLGLALPSSTNDWPSSSAVVGEWMRNAALRFFCFSVSGDYFPTFATVAPLAQDEKVSCNSDSMRVLIRNTIVSHMGSFDWGAIKAQYPTLDVAVKRVQQFINDNPGHDLCSDTPKLIKPDTLGWYLLGSTGTKKVNDILKLHVPLSQLRMKVYCQSAAAVDVRHAADESSEILLCEEPNNSAMGLHNLLVCGAHLFQDSESGTSFYTKPLAQLYHNAHVLTSDHDTFAEATGSLCRLDLPAAYGGNRDLQRLHSAVQLFLLHKNKSDSINTIIPLPSDLKKDAFTVGDEAGAQYGRIGKQYGRIGNICMPYYVFDWGAVTKCYPTLEASVKAEQERLDRWIVPSPIYQRQEDQVYQYKDVIRTELLIKLPAERYSREFDTLTFKKSPVAVIGFTTKKPCLRRLNVNPSHCRHAAFMFDILGMAYTDDPIECICQYCVVEKPAYINNVFKKDEAQIVLEYMYGEACSATRESYNKLCMALRY